MRIKKKGGGSGSKEPTHHRKKYVDQSQKYTGLMNRLGLEKTPFGRTISQLNHRFDLQRVSILFLFCFLLSLLIFLNFEIPANFTEGAVARTTVKSPMSFEMVDEIATEEKKALASKSVPPVYDFDQDTFDNIANAVYDGFREMRVLYADTKWPSSVKAKQAKMREFNDLYKKRFETILGRPISERSFLWLIDREFSVETEALITRVLERWYENKIVGGSADQSGKVVLRYLNQKGREFGFDASEFVDLSDKSKFDIQQVPSMLRLPRKDQRALEKLAYNLMRPNVTPNKNETAERRRLARESVLPVVISVKKNQVIVAEGAVVQPIHISLLERLRELRDNRRQDFRSLLAAMLFVTMILVAFSYLKRFSVRRIHVPNKDMILMGVVTALMVVMTKTFLFITDAAFMHKLSGVIHPSTFLYAAPVAAGSMLVGLVVARGEIVWLFSVFLAAVLGLMVEQNFNFFLVSLITGMAAARGVYECKKRNDIYWAGIRTGLIGSFVIFLFVTMEHFNDPDYLQTLLTTVPAGMFAGIAASMLTMIFIPLIESTFNYTTDIRLLELSNLNHPLLKEMLVRAPGTYHHSMMVGSLVESAAERIGANPLLAKVMAFYHDIGKMEHAEYFIENQRKGYNPHDHISPYMSKTILIAHVKDGAELAMKHNLGKPIIDGILQHHGTGLITYFYNKALQQVDDHCAPPSEDEFRYPGPKPQFREAALVMLSDGIEAAARSLEEPTPVRLQNIVRNIIQRRFMEGQLDECNLTLRDLSKCERSFNRVLLGIYHQRIDYPKGMGGGASERPDNLRVLN